MKNEKSLKTFSEVLDLNLLNESELIKVVGGGERKIPIMTIILADDGG